MDSNKNNVNTYRLLFLLLTIAFSFLCACQGKERNPESTSSIDIAKLQETMLAADTTLPEMVIVSSEMDDAELNFTYLSDMDYGLIASYFIAYAKDGTAPEIAVVEVKDSQDVVSIMDSLKEHVTQRQGTFQEYAPEELDLVDNYVVTSNGNYVALIISKKSGMVQQAFKDSFQ